MRKAIVHFCANTDGSTAVEYSILVAALALGVITAIISLGETLGTLYQTIIAGIASINGAAG